MSAESTLKFRDSPLEPSGGPENLCSAERGGSTDKGSPLQVVGRLGRSEHLLVEGKA
jgi:hypothetical protein